ncbi:MAG: DUF1150 family protein [Rhodospirillaceae bacterium]
MVNTRDTQTSGPLTSGGYQEHASASFPSDLAALGLDHVAYIRRAVVDNMSVWSIHNAAGVQLGATQTRDQAFGAIIQNDLTPLDVN